MGCDSRLLGFPLDLKDPSHPRPFSTISLQMFLPSAFQRLDLIVRPRQTTCVTFSCSPHTNDYVFLHTVQPSTRTLGNTGTVNRVRLECRRQCLGSFFFPLLSFITITTMACPAFLQNEVYLRRRPNLIVQLPAVRKMHSFAYLCYSRRWKRLVCACRHASV